MTVKPNETTREAGAEIVPQVAEQLPSLPKDNAIAGFNDSHGFALIQRIALAFSKSSLVPDTYRGNLPNCLVAMNMAQRLGADPLMTMQNLYVVHGRPGWSSQFLIACFNQCGRFSSMRFDWQGEKGSDDWGCRAWAIEKATGDRIDGTWVTWRMVEEEGWSKRKGSKWLTMPEQMFVYRAASFFTRAYAPELTMGLHSVEEIHDIEIEVKEPVETPQPEAIPETLDDLVPDEEAPEDPAQEDAPPPSERDAMISKIRTLLEAGGDHEKKVAHAYLAAAGVATVSEMPDAADANESGLEPSLRGLLSELEAAS